MENFFILPNQVKYSLIPLVEVGAFPTHLPLPSPASVCVHVRSHTESDLPEGRLTIESPFGGEKNICLKI